MFRNGEAMTAEQWSARFGGLGAFGPGTFTIPEFPRGLSRKLVLDTRYFAL